MKKGGGKGPPGEGEKLWLRFAAPASDGGDLVANGCPVQPLPEKVTPTKRTETASAMISLSKENINNKIECSGGVALNCFLPLGSNRLAEVGRGERAACASCVPVIVF